MPALGSRNVIQPGVCVHDYVYADPPLVEVIAEAYWSTLPLDISPNLAVDVAFNGLSSALPARMEAGGFVSLERLAPPQAPIEMLAGQPILRFRRSPNTWPVYQLGPGVFTCNHTPPYQGWSSFKGVLQSGLDLLVASWPPSYPMQLVKLRLRYIDAFVEKYGYSGNDPIFLKTALTGAGAGLPEALIQHFSNKPESMQVTVASRFAIDSLKGTTASIAFGPGQTAQGSRAYMADFAVEVDCAGSPIGPGDCMPWFDSAHGVVRNLFDRIIDKSLRERFGPVTVINEN